MDKILNKISQISKYVITFTAKVLPGETPFPKHPILSAADAANKARSVADPCKIVHKNT